MTSPRIAKISSKKLFREFEKRLESLENTRKQLESLYSSSVINEEVLTNAYIGLYLNLCTEFEGFLEELFLGLLYKNKGFRQRGVKTLLTLKSNDILRSIIYSGQKYANWLPYNHTFERAGFYFENGAPFTSISGDQKSWLAEMYYIRNVLAHSSDYSKQIFKEKVIQQRTIPESQKTPVGFLRLKVHGNISAYQVHQVRLLNIAKTLVGIPLS